MSFRLRPSNQHLPHHRLGLVRSPSSPQEATFVAKSAMSSTEVLKSNLLGLTEVAHTRIRDLSEEDRRKYNQVVAYVQRNYDNPEGMGVLRALSEEVFQNIKDVQPGTVASYLIGCSRQGPTSSYIKPNCGPLCAGNALNLGTGEVPCETRVFLALRTGPGPALSFINISPTLSEKAIIYLTSPEVQQLSQSEVSELAQMGITKVQLVYYNAKSQQYTLLQDWQDPHQLQQRVDIIPTELSPPGNNNALLIVLLLVLLVIIFYIAWRIYQSAHA